MKRLLWFLPNMVQLSLIALWTTVWVLIAILIAMLTRKADVPLRMAHSIWAPGVLRILLSPVHFQSAQPLDFSRSQMFACNHEASLDIPILFLVLDTPLRFLAKRELFDTPVIGWYMRATGMIPIDRGNRERAFKHLGSVGDRIADGASLVAFPEGTRNHGGEIKPFKRGPFVVAIQNQLQIIPVAIEGSGRVLHRSSMLAIPGPIRVRAGEPISTEGLVVEDRSRLAARVEAAVRALREEAAQPRR